MPKTASSTFSCGHPRTPENIYYHARKHEYRCRICIRISMKEERERLGLTARQRRTEGAYEYYAPVPESGCWLWLGASHISGYGRFSVGGDKSVMAHRAFYHRYKGEIPKGMLVCHKCDTPLCVNPDHLFLGTHSDNALDAVRKGRAAGGPNQPHHASSHGCAKSSISEARASSSIQTDCNRSCDMTGDHDMGAPTLSTLTAQGGDDRPEQCRPNCPPQQTCDYCAPPSEAVWLMPVATQEPGDSNLLRMAWGRSNLSTGQMAHAYDCIVSAAKDCGQVTTPPAPSSSAVEGLVAKWRNEARTEADNGKDKIWAEWVRERHMGAAASLWKCADELEQALASAAASGGDKLAAPLVDGCTDPDRDACPRMCMDFCNAKEERDSVLRAAYVTAHDREEAWLEKSGHLFDPYLPVDAGIRAVLDLFATLTRPESTSAAPAMPDGLLPLPPTGWVRNTDGRWEIRIGGPCPPDRSGGFSTPWTAIYDTHTLRAMLPMLAASAQGDGDGK